LDDAIDDALDGLEDVYQDLGNTLEDAWKSADDTFDALGADIEEVWKDFLDTAVEDAPAPGVFRSRAIGGDGSDVFFGLIPSKSWGALNGAALYGGDGDDFLTGTDQRDLLLGGADSDWISGLGGDDFLFGNSGKDKVLGGAGNDLIAGGSGGDYLDGGNGRDKIYGGSGNDKMIGGPGADWLFCDGGYDTIVFRTAAETRTGTTYDRVYGFTPGKDKFDVSAIDADTGLAGNQAFTYDGKVGLSGEAGQLVLNGSKVLGDVDGDGVADLKFQVDVSSLSAGDFIL
jgi:Ca2+-binding RTX toxin-like protein